MPSFRPAYLICGDDHGRIGERRTRLRAMAEAESGAGGVELLEGDACTPDAVAARAGQLLRVGKLRLHVLWPPRPPPGWRPDGNPNDRAVVAHVRDGDFDLLLPADAETNVTAALDLPRVEALKVAHHGSADEGLPALLERTAPLVAAIEVGADNTYGHPAPSTLAALRAIPRLVRTDRDGTVRLHVAGGRMRLERVRPEIAAIEVGADNTYGHPTPSTLAALRAVDHVYRTDRGGTVRLRVRNGAMTIERAP